MNIFSVHGLLPLSCLPESLMVGSILVPWWGWNQIACDDKWCKIELERILLCVHDVSFVACPPPSSLFSVSASFLMVLPLFLVPEWGGLLPPLLCQRWGGTVSGSLSWMWFWGGETTVGLQEGGSSAPPWGSVACQAGDFCTSDWWRRAKECHHLLVLQLQHRDGFGYFVMGMSWPLVTSKGR